MYKYKLTDTGTQRWAQSTAQVGWIPGKRPGVRSMYSLPCR